MNAATTRPARTPQVGDRVTLKGTAFIVTSVRTHKNMGLQVTLAEAPTATERLHG